jgi:hypothetical protein
MARDLPIADPPVQLDRISGNAVVLSGGAKMAESCGMSQARVRNSLTPSSSVSPALLASQWPTSHAMCGCALHVTIVKVSECGLERFPAAFVAVIVRV